LIWNLFSTLQAGSSCFSFLDLYIPLQYLDAIMIDSMIGKISSYILKMWGWKKTGRLPSDKKFILVVAPHTSNWDYVIGMLFCFSVGIKSRILIKKELFWFPLGNLLKALGGIPVHRQQKTDIVEQIIREFNENESFILTITPEGTRKRVSEWKTGFHRIAAGAGVPVLPGFLDYRKKVVGTGDFFMFTGNLETDMKIVKDYYREITPKYPANFTTGNE